MARKPTAATPEPTSDMTPKERKAATVAAKAEALAKQAADKKAADAEAKAERKRQAEARRQEREQNPDTISTGVVDRSRYNYVTTKDVKTASGRASVDNDDPLATALRGKSAEEVVELVTSNGGEAKESWSNLNAGLMRMSAGNVLRRLAKRTEGIEIDGQTLTISA